MHDGRTFIISYANLRGRAGNAYYPLQQIVSDVETLAKVTACDHVCGSFKNDRRGKKNFISADVLAMDLDNGDGGWTTAEDVVRLLPDVEFYAVPSRHHMQPKEDKPARPRFHFYFPLAVVVDDASVLAELKQRVLNRVPAFDSNAVDAARFYYGVENPTPTHFAGSYCIDELVGVPSADDGIQGNGRGVSEMAAPCGGRYDGAYQCGGNAIPEGQRNSTLYKFAVRKLKRHGESEEAKGAYLREADKCDPHLPTEELKTIWNSAVKFYRETVLKDPTYISPDRFGQDDLLSEEMRGQSLEPSDYSDVSQAMTFVKAYARLAGIASGEARQRRKLMRETATGILKAPAAIPEIAAALEEAGFDNSYQSAIMLAAIQKAACGDIEAARFVRDTIGEKPTDQFNIAAVQRPIQEMDLSQMSDAELQSLIRSADDSEY